MDTIVGLVLGAIFLFLAVAIPLALVRWVFKIEEIVFRLKSIHSELVKLNNSNAQE